MPRSTAIREYATFADDLATALVRERQIEASIRWPDGRYARDPAAFFFYILGVELWDAQLRICDAILSNHQVSVKSGRRVGKSALASGLGLWRYASFERGQVLLSSATFTQIDDILWTEIKRLPRGSWQGNHRHRYLD